MKKFFDPLTADILCKVKNDVAVSPHYHRHDGSEIFILLGGDVNYYIEQHCYRLSRGSLVVINPEEYHRSELLNRQSYERIVVNIRTTFFETLSTQQTDLTSCFLDRPYSERNLIQLSNRDLQEFLVLARQLEAALMEQRYGYDLMALSYLLQILVKTNRLYRSSSTRELSSLPDLMPSLVRDTMVYIEEHLTEPISLADLSGNFYHNGTYISRRFKSVTGLTIQQYILYKRISLAQKYLQEGRSLSDACWMSGFNNYSNFSRSFTRQVGCSPKKYQNTYTPPPKSFDTFKCSVVLSDSLFFCTEAEPLLFYPDAKRRQQPVSFPDCRRRFISPSVFCRIASLPEVYFSLAACISAFTLSSAALNACSCVIAFSVRWMQSRISCPK